MVYLEYEKCKQELQKAQGLYERILKRKEELFDKTQPTSPAMGKVSGGERVNRFDTYLIKSEDEELDTLLLWTKKLLEGRKLLVKYKEDELSTSRELHDRIYYYRYVEGNKISSVAKAVGYSEAQTYRILRTIKRDIEMLNKKI